MKSIEEFEKLLEEYDRVKPHEYDSKCWQFRIIAKILIEILREVRSGNEK